MKTLLPALAMMALVVSSRAQGPLQNGGNHDGSISVIGETDTWTIDADEGSTLRIQVAVISGSDFEPLLRLYAPGGALITSNSGIDTTEVSHLATVSGTYTVEILDSSPTPNGTGDYRIHSAIPGAPFIVPPGDEGGAVSSGEIRPGSIDPADIDLYSFDASAGQTIRLGLGETTATSFQPFILLYGPDGVLIVSNSGSTSTDLSVSAPVAGTYTAVVQDGNNDVTGAGDYNLYLAVLGRPFSVPPGDEGGAVSSGEIRSGTIALGDIDLYAFDASAGQTIRLGLGETSGTGFQPFILLYGPDGALIDSNSGSLSTEVSAIAAVAGSYTVVVQDGNADVTGAGDYNLYLAVLGRSFSTPPGDEGGAMGSGEIQSGTIALGDIDLYSFDASAGQTIRLGLGETTASGFQPFVLLYGPDGTLIDSNSGSLSTEVTATATVAGSYTVAVQDGNADVTGSGDYNLYLAVLGRPFNVPSGDEGGTVASGTSTGTVVLGDIDLYAFDADSGDSITASAEDTGTTSLSPAILLYDFNGSLVASDTDATLAQINTVIGVSGTYTLVVQDANADVTGSGAYELVFNLTPGGSSVPGGGSSGSISNGGFVDGSIGALGDLDKWTFTAAAGEEVFVQADRTAGSTSFNPRLRIYSPGGSLIALDSGSATATTRFTAVAAGTFTAVFDEAGADTTGDYRIFLARCTSGFGVPSGDEGGTLANGLNYEADITRGDIDLWDFEAQTGETIRLQTGRTAGTTSFNPELRVYAPDGERVAFDTGSSTASISFAATQSGTHTVVVRENDTDTSGSYRLHFARIPFAYSVTGGDEGGTLSNGLNQEADITLGDLDLWDFEAQVGETIRLQTGRTGGTTSFNPEMRVYAPYGERVAFDTGSSTTSIVFTATQSGTYSVVVQENDTDTSGSYRLHFARIPTGYSVSGGDEGGAFESGDPLGGALSLGDLDTWSFHAASGDVISLAAARITGSTSFNPNIVLYGPDGEIVATATGGSLAEILFTITQTGYHTLVVRENGNDTSGTYSLTATGMTALPAEISLSSPLPGQLRFAWPAPSNGWELQESLTLLPGSWGPSASAPGDNGFEKSITIDTSLFPERFFRLRKP